MRRLEKHFFFLEKITRTSKLFFIYFLVEKIINFQLCINVEKSKFWEIVFYDVAQSRGWAAAASAYDNLTPPPQPLPRQSHEQLYNCLIIHICICVSLNYVYRGVLMLVNLQNHIFFLNYFKKISAKTTFFNTLHTCIQACTYVHRYAYRYNVYIKIYKMSRAVLSSSAQRS